jgi:hypothetical protein
MTLDLTSGVPKVVFSRNTQIDIEFVENDDEEIIESSGSIDFEIHRWTRGQSLDNERGCDEIVLQFMNGLESSFEPFGVSGEINASLQTD